MANQVDNKFTWVITKFSSLQSKKIYSDEFIIAGCKWNLVASAKGLFKRDCFNLFLQVANYRRPLTSGWRRHVLFKFTIVNQNPENNFQLKEKHKWFDQRTSMWISGEMLPFSKLVAKDGGFLVNDEVKIVAELDVLEVIGRLDVSEDVTRPLKKTKLNVQGEVPGELLKETIDINGFEVLPSQVESVRSIFEKHPDIALGFRAKNQHLRTACMNVLLSLTAILGQLPREVSKDDLAYAYGLLRSTKEAGFKVDWLEKKLNELSEKKEKEKACKMRMQEIQKEWRELKAKVLAAKAPLTLDDVV